MTLRWAILGAAVVLCGAAAALLYRFGPNGLGVGSVCLFHRWTGLHCAGCGMTRATYALMHGDPGTAFRYNPLGVILFPIALFGSSIEAIAWARGKPLSWRLRVGARGAVGLLWVVVAFWILRNLPWWPFTLLAPPA